jgi:preprotein translocase subunit SecD
MTVPGVFAIHREVRPIERCPAEQPPGMACLPDRDEGRGAYVLLVEPALVGDVLAEVGMSVDPGGYPALTIRFRADAARRFGELTTRALGQPLAIVIDGEVIIAPVVREPILGGSAVLTGTEEDIALWAAMLGRPPLPVRLEVLAVEAAEPVVRGRRRR